jgi:phosphomannomutase/phosphoglucomutase
MASIFFASRVSRSGRPLSTLAAEVPVRPITPDIRLAADAKAAARIIEQLRTGLAGEARITTLDGTRAAYENGWGLARASVTEPLVTLRFEGDDEAALDWIMARFEAAAPELAGRLPRRAREQGI